MTMDGKGTGLKTRHYEKSRKAVPSLLLGMTETQVQNRHLGHPADREIGAPGEARLSLGLGRRDGRHE